MIKTHEDFILIEKTYTIEYVRKYAKNLLLELQLYWL